MTLRTTLTGTTAFALALTATLTSASSHREAPGITEQPKIDATDFYMFRSYEEGRADYVTLIANYQPLQAPYGGPNYFTLDNDAIYEIHIDNDGDAIEDITFQFNFDSALAADGNGVALTVGGVDVPIPLRAAGMITEDNADGDMSPLNESETYSVTMISGDRRSGTRAPLTSGGSATFTKPADYFGTKTFPNYDAYANAYIYDGVTIGDCGAAKVFVGQRAETFAVNLGEVFDLVNLVPIQGVNNPAWPQYASDVVFTNGIVQDRANDDLIGESNVTSIAIEVPIACLTGDGNGVIGGWTTASLPQAELENPSPTYNRTSIYGGAWVQQSRLGAPLVNEVVIGLPDKDLFNAAEPTQDGALAVYVTNPTLPALINLLFKDAVNATLMTSFEDIAPTVDDEGRTDLVAAFLTGFEGFNQLATVTGSEMLRLNTGVDPTPRDAQNTFGVVAEDLAGFPNGRRPGDDVVDIELRVAMGALCYDVPLGAELNPDNPDFVEDTDSDLINLGYCLPEDAPVGFAPITDGAPLRATETLASFPYLNTPLPGAGG